MTDLLSRPCDACGEAIGGGFKRSGKITFIVTQRVIEHTEEWETSVFSELEQRTH